MSRTPAWQRCPDFVPFHEVPDGVDAYECELCGEVTDDDSTLQPVSDENNIQRWACIWCRRDLIP